MEADIAVNKSTFVTVIAWIGIVVTGFSTFMTGLQNIILNVMMEESFDEQVKMADEEALEMMPAFATFMFSHFELIFFLIFLISLLAFIASIGLLKRKNWGRLIITGILIIGIAWNVGGLFLQQSVMSEMEEMQSEIQIEETQEQQAQSAESSEPCCENDPCCDDDNTMTDEAKIDIEAMDKKMRSMIKIITVVSIIFSLILSIVMGWVVWKLNTPPIMVEFKNVSLMAVSNY